jgi:rhamnulose-1-phosphate aldolase
MENRPREEPSRTLPEPNPSLAELMDLVGEAGNRLVEIEAAEGAAGNISVYVGWEVDVSAHFPREQPFALPEPVPELAGKLFLVTGSGRRLREIGRDPEANLGVIRVLPGGASATLYTSERCLFERPTSEFNSHLAVHRAMIQRDSLNFHALVHAQPLYLTYLSHIPRYSDTRYLNRHILRWQPETLVQLPRGVAFLPFLLPGSSELMAATVSAMEEGYRVVLWAKHGVMARSDQSVKRAADRIEYAETGARYEYLNLTNHGLADGLTDDELRRIAEKFGVEQDYF